MGSYQNDIKTSLKTLQSGGVILYPTDTIWGLGCDCADTDAIQKIYSIKQRKESKSLILLADGIEMICDYADEVSISAKAMLSNPKKPTTFIFKQAKNLPKELIAEDGSIAFRIPEDDFCIALINQLGRPIISTSANISGEAPPQNFAKISNEIKQQADYVVTHRQDDTSTNQSSTILKIVDDEIVVIRK